MKVSLARIKRLISTPILDKLAIQYNVNAENQVRLPGQTVFMCLLNGLLNHSELSLRMLEDQYQKLTKESCDHSSFGKRLSSINPDYFRAILDHLYQKISPSGKDLKATRLRFVDATIVTLSAKLLTFGIKANHGKKGLKSQVKSVIELSEDGLPNLLHICKDQSEFSDVVALGKPMKSNTKKGDIWIFDKGCHGRHVLFSLHQSGSFWITPHTNHSFDVIETLYKTNPELPDSIPEKNEPILKIHKVEYCVFSNKWSKIPGLKSMGIIVIHCYRWDMRNKCWKPFVLMTNLPLSQSKTKAGPYSFEEVTELYRRRWDIETFFKLLKQHLGYEHLISRSENGIRVAILMSMITALLMIWYKQVANIQLGWKSVKFWFADDVRHWATCSLREMDVSKT